MSEHTQPDAEQSQPLTDEEVEQQRSRARRTGLILVLFMLLVGGAAFYYLWNMRLEAGNAESINVLLVGVSDEEANEGVEALVVTSFRPHGEGIEALALPVNTSLPWTARVPVVTPNANAGSAEPDSVDDESLDAAEDVVPPPEPVTDELRDAYAGGNRAALTDAVERLLDVPVHHTVKVDFDGFVELVDLLDGVPVEVQTDVVYRDLEGEELFRLEPGSHRLSGEEALLYVRYKGDHLEDDSRRVARQWQVAEALLAEARTKLGWSEVQKLIGIALNYVTTDLDVVDVTRLLKIAYDLERDGYIMHMLPGYPEEGRWVAEPAAVAALGEQMFHNPSWEGTED